jgi:hypothetical protein
MRQVDILGVVRHAIFSLARLATNFRHDPGGRKLSAKKIRDDNPPWSYMPGKHTRRNCMWNKKNTKNV